MPPSRISHRAQGGPDLNYLYATTHRDEEDDNSSNNTKLNKKQNNKSTKRPVQRGRKSDKRTLRGTTLYLGGEEGPNAKIYCIPGHAERVLCIDTKTDEVYPIGPEFDASNMILNGKFKWLRGIVIGDIIYGLPCHADCILRIDTKTDEVGTIDIPYEDYFNNETKEEGEESMAYNERHCPWKYHGGAISPHDGCMYAIPQSAKKVLRIDPKTEKCSFVGPDFEGRCKWYGGVVGKTDGAVYAIPQNAEGVLRIDASGVNYKGEIQHDNNGLDPSSPEARVLVTTHGSYPQGEHKWHGAAASFDGSIVSVPANADTTLCIVPALEAAYPSSSSEDANKVNILPEPELYILEGQAPGDIATGRHRDDKKYKYLGAMAGTDGHVYCFPSGSERVLQVDTGKRIARSVGPNLRDENMERLFQNKWQNGLTHYGEGCVYAIPLAAETVLRIRTGPGNNDGGNTTYDESNSEPEVTTWKLPLPSNTLEKWEGGTIASNGIMYCMPNNHKAVLQIVPPCVPSREALHQENDRKEKEREKAREIQKQQRQQEMERKKAEKERKRQERLERKKNGKGNNDGGEGAAVVAQEEEKKEEDTTIKTTRTTPPSKPKTTPLVRNNDEVTCDGVPFKYKSGIPTLRSATHRVKYSLEHRKQHNPKPKAKDGSLTNTTFLPAELCEEHLLKYSTEDYDFHGAVVDMLQGCDKELVGTFRTLNDCTVSTPKLDNFTVPPKSLTRKCQKGKLQEAQECLSDALISHTGFMGVFDSFVVNKVLPHFKERLRVAGVHEGDKPITFHYQRPPTLRIQPGPARAYVRAHDDAEYGHQNGELNFWLPLTSRRKTGVDLMCESKAGAGDFHPLKAEYGEVVSFHGSSCRHNVNANHSPWTRVSLDFRVGVEGFFDAQWQMIGTTNDHSRRKITL